MSDKRRFVLGAHAEARSRAIDCVKHAPDGYVVTVAPAKRSLEANAALHAEIAEIAASMPWAGKMRSVETWKRLLVASWMRAVGESVEVMPALDGHGVDIVYAPTSQMSGAQVRELIDFIGAWRAENACEA